MRYSENQVDFLHNNALWRDLELLTSVPVWCKRRFLFNTTVSKKIYKAYLSDIFHLSIYRISFRILLIKCFNSSCHFVATLELVDRNNQKFSTCPYIEIKHQKQAFLKVAVLLSLQLQLTERIRSILKWRTKLCLWTQAFQHFIRCQNYRRC